MSQSSDILAHLRTGRPITPTIALTLYNCMRLAARIDDLRLRGHNIKTTMRSSGKSRWAEYRLVPDGAGSEGEAHV